MQAQNRNLKDWHGKIQRSEIKLPRFQRFEAWDRKRICSLIETVIRNLPLGITLVLEVGENELFISRHLHTAPERDVKIHEHLLDGQQRLTALWRVFQNNYESETYFIYSKNLGNLENNVEEEDHSVKCYGRYCKNGARYPRWCDSPSETLSRGLIPTSLLCPDDMQQNIDDWIDAATRAKKPEDNNSYEELESFFRYREQVRDIIRDLRSVVSNYNLPYLSLASQTEKSVALDVFVNMNTNSKPLSTYDIIVAEVEGAMGRSLHDLEKGLREQYPDVSNYSDSDSESPLSDLILNTSALLQGHLPNQRGAWNMDKKNMVEHWATLEQGLERMAQFLTIEGIYDRKRLPTNAVLAVIGALYRDIPVSGDKLGQDELLLKRYLWHAFFTDRYENAAATHAFADFNALRRILRNETKSDGTAYGHSDVPIFFQHTLVEAEELMVAEWPKRASIRGRGILAVACRLGALDFSTGKPLDKNNIGDRHYHHIFPSALLEEAEINGSLALNCALITDTTNISIGCKDPLAYLKDRYKWTTQGIVNERLQSHLIPIKELSRGGYEGIDEKQKKTKLKNDFEAFLSARAELTIKAMEYLAEGRQLSVGDFFSVS